jgi:hypothetical protein
VIKRTLGEDIQKADFWAAAIRSLAEPLARLQTLLPQVLPTSVATQKIDSECEKL